MPVDLSNPEYVVKNPFIPLLLSIFTILQAGRSFPVYICPRVASPTDTPQVTTVGQHPSASILYLEVHRQVTYSPSKKDNRLKALAYPDTFSRHISAIVH
ncbi:hypothetical protein K470DRAFT_260970 [Piedraia hortae CBS 480.64]|uniref:Uncharacterized protein n=1 Tax=Piedraia hortae CBS 480.64 TaxID=1314780 RepID=A0A6A7BQW2_9PEZI|nr:hypothetical protein K470DRAFT_260970 [Piedraia hortae CBS 480.64]